MKKLLTMGLVVLLIVANTLVVVAQETDTGTTVISASIAGFISVSADNLVWALEYEENTSDPVDVSVDSNTAWNLVATAGNEGLFSNTAAGYDLATAVEVGLLDEDPIGDLSSPQTLFSGSGKKDLEVVFYQYVEAGAPAGNYTVTITYTASVTVDDD